MNFTRKVATSIAALMIAGQAWSANYSSFQVVGNERIQDSIVLGTAGLTQGVAVDDAGLNAAIQRLFTSGLFSDVDVRIVNGRAVITVVENATISGIYFEGNDKVKDEQLASIVSLGARDGLDKAKIEEDIQSIRRFYAARSRFDVDIKAQAISNNNGTYKLIFVVDEGSVSEIDRITFSGNEGVSDWVLRRVVNSSEAGIFSNLFSQDNFATEKLAADKDAILNYYRENGYYDVQIRASSADYDAGGNFFISYSILEGPKYQIGNITYESKIAGVETGVFEPLVGIRSGKIFKASDIIKAVEAIEIEAERRGLPFLRANPVITTRENDGLLDIEFVLESASRVYVERIDIHGNDQTIDRVIRRKFETSEGDPLNGRKIAEARQELESLGFFNRVQVVSREGSTIDKKIIDVEVEEANTGSLSFGGGYSSSDSWSVNVNFTERNFLGRGQYLALSVDYGANAQTGRLSFAEPALFDRDLLGAFDLYYSQSASAASGYSTTNIGFEPRISLPTGENSRLTLGYFIKSNDLTTEDYTSTSPLVGADEGKLVTSGVSASWVIDKTDNKRSPSKGWIFRLGGKIAGLGGDAQWTQAATKAKVFYPVWNNEIILSAEVEGGAIQPYGDTTSVRINERFMLGGNNGLTGFNSGGLGPRDSLGEINSALGGNYYAAARANVSFPLGLPESFGITGAAFWEVGSVWGLDNVDGGASGVVDDSFKLRGTRGLSLLWNLGGQTLAFNFADPYQQEEGDETEQFTVSFVSKF